MKKPFNYPDANTVLRALSAELGELRAKADRNLSKDDNLFKKGAWEGYVQTIADVAEWRSKQNK